MTTNTSHTGKAITTGYTFWAHCLDNSVVTIQFPSHRRALRYLGIARAWTGEEMIWEWQITHNRTGRVVLSVPHKYIELPRQLLHLGGRIPDSLVLPFKRKGQPSQWRRYFPLYGKTEEERLREAFFIFFGKWPEYEGQIGEAVFFSGFDKKIQRINGKWYTRTIGLIPSVT